MTEFLVCALEEEVESLYMAASRPRQPPTPGAAARKAAAAQTAENDFTALQPFLEVCAAA